VGGCICDICHAVVCGGEISGWGGEVVGEVVDWHDNSGAFELGHDERMKGLCAGLEDLFKRCEDVCLSYSLAGVKLFPVRMPSIRQMVISTDKSDRKAIPCRL
jgi:hypothetical protein